MTLLNLNVKEVYHATGVKSSSTGPTDQPSWRVRLPLAPLSDLYTIEYMGQQHSLVMVRRDYAYPAPPNYPSGVTVKSCSFRWRRPRNICPDGLTYSPRLDRKHPVGDLGSLAGRKGASCPEATLNADSPSPVFLLTL